MKRIAITVTCFLYFFANVAANAAIGYADKLTPTGPKTHNENFSIEGIFVNHELQKPGISQKFGPVNQVCSGVNIHFVKGQERDLDMIATAGFRFIRMDFAWEDIEQKKGTYSWTAYDELTANLNKRGLRAIYIFDYSNPLYEDPVVSKDPLTGKEQKDIASPQHPESIAAFVRWAAASAEHFRNSNIIWEIWNEPNIFFWKPKPDVRQYIALAIATCKAVRAVVPEATIIGPASSEVPLPFLESFLASGVLEYIDAVSVHPYREYSKSPETAATDYNELRELMELYSPPDKKMLPVISSEWGYSSSTKGVSLEKQEAYIVRMQLSNLLNGIPVSIWYDWKNDGDDPSEHEQNFGTVSSDLKPKAAYTAIMTMNRQLKGFTFLHRMDFKSDNDYVMLFKNEEGNYKIVAWTTDQTHQIIMDTNIPQGTGATAENGRGEELKIKTDKGRLVLELNELPQYLSLPSGIRMN